jgi:prepilin-type N-terminal cleavage/methylation domain-containing protein
MGRRLRFQRETARTQGFTLVESMIALTILAVGLLAMLGLQMQAMRQSEWGRHTTEGARIARDQLEAFNRAPWGAAVLQPTGWTAATSVASTVQLVNGTRTQQAFDVQWRITTDASEPNLRLIDVRVQWREEDQDPASPSRRYAVSSMRYNN